MEQTRNGRGSRTASMLDDSRCTDDALMMHKMHHILNDWDSSSHLETTHEQEFSSSGTSFPTYRNNNDEEMD